MLRDVWYTVSTEEMEKIVRQLKGYVDELRGVAGTFIGRVDGGPCEDRIFESGGPYETEEAFNEGIVEAMRSFSGGIFTEMVADVVRALLKHKFVLTYGDIALRNIIVHGGKVVAILDWELSGF